ncbi:MAG: helix-turn-helix domain-containing protein [Chloroflexota bacterium]
MEHGKRRRSAVHGAGYQYLLRRLREARLRAGLTQVEVAKALGRHQSYVTKCELGERRIDPIDLQRFAKLYRKPFSYFLQAKNDP